MGTAGAAMSGVAFGSFGVAAADSPVVAQQLANKEKQVCFVWIDGGMSQFESWDPKPKTTFGGPFRTISTSLPGVHVSELMPRTAKIMHHLAVVRSMATTDNSHSAGVPRIQRGDPKNRGVIYPFFGSAVAKLLGPCQSGLPPYVWLKPGNGGFIHADGGFLGPKFGAVAFGDGKPPENLVRAATVSDAEDAERNVLREAINKRYAERRAKNASEANGAVYEMARKLMERRELFDTSKYDPKDVERYGKVEMGPLMLQALKMLEAGVRFVKVNSYGWDTHGDNFNGHLSLMPRFDAAFASLIEDLHARGMLENVLVIAMSEFGRTPRINGHLGRDHWPEAWSVCMGGRGIKKGVVAGKTNEKGTDVATEPHDIGHLFHTWFRALGVDPEKQKYYNATQPLPIAHEEMHAVKEVLA